MEEIWDKLTLSGFKVSIDTRKNVRGSVFFAIKGDNFDGRDFVEEALNKGAITAVSENTLEILQKLARRHRDTFSIPIICIGGSNGKTTSKELIRDVLSKSYKTYATSGNFNNHIGLPLSIFAMPKDTELGIFEIGANHLGEHTALLEILAPTHVVVTNNGLDHLGGFGSPAGVRKANKELYDWAKTHGAKAFVHKGHSDLVEDSMGLEIIPYPAHGEQAYKTKLFGKYNFENIELALAVGKHFAVEESQALEAIGNYTPQNRRSEVRKIGSNTFIVDCYNANPSSMAHALESFIQETKSPRGVILGDMLELGNYAEKEHRKIFEMLDNKFDLVVLIGENFREVAGKTLWFKDAKEARTWFEKEGLTGYTILLKGSRGMTLEKLIE